MASASYRPCLALTAAFLLICLSGCATQKAVRVNPPPYRIVGYVTAMADIPTIQAEKLTDLIFAFAQVRDSGEVYLPDRGVSGKIFQLCALKKRNPDLRILISVGGWGADHFSDAALTEDSRRTFAESSAALVDLYHLDGLDVDWEYPGQGIAGIKFRPEDKHNFTLLLKEVRAVFDADSRAHGRAPGDGLLLTIASADAEYFEHTEMDLIHPYLDWFNVMTYDFYGSLTKITGHHTGLYSAPGSPDGLRCAAGSIEQHLAAGIPASKLVLGAAFYGKSWTGVRPDNHGILQPYGSFGNWLTYGQLVQDYVGKKGFEAGWDEVAQAPYLWNPKTRVFVSYDDPRSIHQKDIYIQKLKLGGLMYWEQSQDPQGVLLGAVYSDLGH